jgi:hypothetical protein
MNIVPISYAEAVRLHPDAMQDFCANMRDEDHSLNASTDSEILQAAHDSGNRFGMDGEGSLWCWDKDDPRVSLMIYSEDGGWEMAED